MNSNQASGSAAALVRLAEQGANSAQIAEAFLNAWQRMHDALVPIVGPRGVAALFSRALHVTGNDHAWLPSPSSFAGSVNLQALRVALCARSGAESALAGDALLHSFFALLSGLVGQSLADHLVGPLHIEIPRGESAQDT